MNNHTGSPLVQAAHEFNNLLSIISSYTGVLESDLPDPPDSVREAIGAIRGAVERGTRLTARLLTERASHERS